MIKFPAFSDFHYEKMRFFLNSARVKSPDSNKVTAIFEKYRGTVILAINGHYHTDNFTKENGVRPQISDYKTELQKRDGRRVLITPPSLI